MLRNLKAVFGYGERVIWKVTWTIDLKFQPIARIYPKRSHHRSRNVEYFDIFQPNEESTLVTLLREIDFFFNIFLKYTASKIFVRKDFLEFVKLRNL